MHTQYNRTALNVEQWRGQRTARPGRPHRYPTPRAPPATVHPDRARLHVRRRAAAHDTRVGPPEGDRAGDRTAGGAGGLGGRLAGPVWTGGKTIDGRLTCWDRGGGPAQRGDGRRRRGRKRAGGGLGTGGDQRWGTGVLGRTRRGRPRATGGEGEGEAVTGEAAAGAGAGQIGRAHV